ncbi:ribonuclease Oy [Caerostris darwini]|uniref:Ribonuclease Oy n=1 Tax=Caerostris darwini TaxID=1538125 RepID=A0AAV4S7J7_9ARAC|nr:ribonuclease Oy [Caerostris darwini]
MRINFLAITVIFVEFCIGFGAESNKTWTYFVFAQQWPPAACLQVPGGKCKIPDVVSDWTIHGLWPTSDKGYPSFCNKSWPFKPDLIKPLLLSLEEYWPNIYADSSEITFWKHEWTKHGTCATSLKNFNSERKYFWQSLVLQNKYNIHDFLGRAGIFPNPDKPLLLTYIENAIYKQVNQTIKLFCKNHEQYSQPVLTSMYVCLNKKLQTIDCDKIDEPTCKKTYVYYLPFPKQVVGF